METLENIKSRLLLMGFSLKDGDTKTVYYKKYKDFEDYELKIELNENNYKQSKIEYGVASDRKTTENLHQKETFVVIECFNRLLEMGYSPKEIILEKAYPSGRKDKGQFLDILVTKDGRPYYMIECKQYGDEYKKELKNLEEDGGQLFTYYTNDREVKAICLYSSTVSENGINAEYKIIDTSNFNGSNKEEIFSQWNKDYTINAIFNKRYDIGSTGITIDNLYDIKEDKTLYNEFAKILRKYAVSDLTNAYNKLFNLFLCKIVDEDKAFHKSTYDIQFQWKSNETSYDVLDRLSNLYKEGVYIYLGIQVTDYSFDKIKEHIQSISNGNVHISEELEKEFKELRFIKNNEFSFIEVFNEETFKQNSLILKEVVKLFEKVKIKYSDKHQILGDFFERLLNIGIKQTEGQFFTPIPIANFIVNSIPYEKIIKSKIEKEEHYFLPYIIDYACGAGHFLTEYMHRIEEILKKDKNEHLLKDLTGPQSDNYNIWKAKSFGWAKEFVYGIEKDYRLTKTSKIACFLNGDGDANVITANGLDSFDSEAYRGYKQLYQNKTNYCREILNFDCVIANPPYAVDDFKETLKNSLGINYGNKNFELFNALGEKSDDIECLFVERTSQLLKDGGYAGIILSDKFLNNLTKTHKKTREFLIENFKIKGIVELGEGAFASTSTNTIVLFMEKRAKNEKVILKEILSNFKKNLLDFNYKNTQNIISHFLEDIYGNISFNAYISFLQNKPSEEFKNSELYQEYKISTMQNLKKNKNKDDIKQNDNIDLKKLIDNEYKKIYIYLLNFKEQVIVSESGDNKKEIHSYLGYKVSKRKGNEGLKEIKDLSDEIQTELNCLTDKTCFNSKLCNPFNLYDENKISYYLYQFLNKGCLNDKELSKMDSIFENKLSYIQINDLFDFDKIDFNLCIDIHKESIEIIVSKYPKFRLSTILEKIEKPTTVKKENLLNNGKYPAISQDNEKICGYTNEEPPINDLPVILFGDHNCRTKYIEEPFVRAGDGAKIFKINRTNILPKYVYYIIEGLIKPNGYKRHTKILRNIKIPIPIKLDGSFDIDKQKEIVFYLDKIENDKYSEEDIQKGKKQNLKKEILNKYLQ